MNFVGKTIKKIKDEPQSAEIIRRKEEWNIGTRE